MAVLDQVLTVDAAVKPSGDCKRFIAAADGISASSWAARRRDLSQLEANTAIYPGHARSVSLHRTEAAQCHPNGRPLPGRRMATRWAVQTEIQRVLESPLQNFAGLYFSHRHGIFTESLWDEIEPTMSDVIADPGTRHWWATPRHWQRQEFAHVVDEIIARGDKPQAYLIYNLHELIPPKDGGKR